MRMFKSVGFKIDSICALFVCLAWNIVIMSQLQSQYIIIMSRLFICMLWIMAERISVIIITLCHSCLYTIWKALEIRVSLALRIWTGRGGGGFSAAGRWSATSPMRLARYLNIIMFELIAIWPRCTTSLFVVIVHVQFLLCRCRRHMFHRRHFRIDFCIYVWRMFFLLCQVGHGWSSAVRLRKLVNLNKRRLYKTMMYNAVASPGIYIREGPWLKPETLRSILARSPMNLFVTSV